MTNYKRESAKGIVDMHNINLNGYNAFRDMYSQVANDELLEVDAAYLMLNKARVTPRELFTNRAMSQEMLEDAAHGSVDTVKGYLNYGVSVNYSDPFDGRTALHHAVIKGSDELVHFLVLNNADIDKLDEYGRSPTDYAQDCDNIKIKNFLKDIKENKTALIIEMKNFSCR